MLDKIFLQVLNMSFTASFVIAFVLITRLLLKKSAKVFSYALWSVVLFRLTCPVSFESTFTVLPTAIQQNTMISEWTDDYIGETQFFHDNRPEYDIAVSNGREPIAAGEDGFYVVTGADGISAPKTVANTLVAKLVSLWVIAIAVLLIYSLSMLFRLKKKLRNATLLKENIYLSDNISTAFVLGVFRPKIYLPLSLSDKEQDYILLHEKTHIKRLDHVVKIVSFAVLCLHWFNPLVWLAFFLCGKDMEMSCDETVIKKLGAEVKKDYSATLLTLATGRRIVGGTPLAFGEGDTKSRIKNVLNYKKPAFWVIVVSAIAVVTVGIGLAANPKNDSLIIPKTDEVTGVRIEQINEGKSLGIIETDDRKQIELTLKALQNTNKTMKDSVNDSPNRNDYFQIDINASEPLRLYLYNDEKQYYIEDPYVGIYKTSRETSVSIASIYTSNGGVGLVPLNAMRPMILVDGILYLDTGKEVSEKIEDSAVLGEITSAASASEKPTENGQCNFSSGMGAKYATYETGMAVFLDNKWFFFEQETETTDIGVTTGAKLSSLPKEYSSSMAEKNGDYVDVHGNISNSETMDYFISAVSKQEKAFIRTTIYTIEGDPVITDFDFDGKSFSVYRDTTRDKFGNQEIKNYTYQNLVPFISHSGSKTQYFFITNLNEITQKDFEEGVDGVILSRTDLPQSTGGPVPLNIP